MRVRTPCLEAMKTSLSLLLIATTLLLHATVHAAPPAGWTEDYAKALAEAKTQKKDVLLDFTGSDWCGWCMKIDKEIFETPKFKTWARQKLVLVKVDFPHSKPQSPKIKDQNKKLQSEHHVRGFPTLVIVDAEGKKLWENVGYIKGGPDAFIESVGDKLTNKN